LVTANNHSNDSYASGLKKTLDIVDGYGFLHTGTFRDADERLLYYPLLVYKNDFKIAFLNYTYGTNGIPTREPTIVNLIDTELIEADLKEAKMLQPDAIIVVMHWGDEYQLQENAEQRMLANKIFSWGADIIIGSHPHVVQPVKEVALDSTHNLEKGLVAYSLGNFISGQTKTNTDGGIIIELTLQKNLTNGKTTLKDHSVTPVWRYIFKDGDKTDYVLVTEEELGANEDEYLTSTAISKMNTFLKNLKNHLGKSDARLNSTVSSTVEMK
ncbi:MAG: CapA family protein, partial [Saprospiraceae bacterium]|nr:CapA family protein [Saprospiraceae bacterium]